MTVAEYLIGVTSRYDILHHLHPVFVFHRVALFYSSLPIFCHMRCEWNVGPTNYCVRFLRPAVNGPNVW